MVCLIKRRQQIFQGLTPEQRGAIVQIYSGGAKAYSEISIKVRRDLITFRYIRENGGTGIVSILPEGKRAALVIISGA